MKKFLAILLLFDLLFNSVGYRLVWFFLEQKAHVEAISMIDKRDYNESKLIKVTIPLKLPYSMEWKDFERVDGEIEVGGVYYRYVKRKVIVDSLIILCLPDANRQKLVTAKKNFVERIVGNFDKFPEKKGQTPALLKTLCSEYIEVCNLWKINTFPHPKNNYIVKNIAVFSLYEYPGLLRPPAHLLYS